MVAISCVADLVSLVMVFGTSSIPNNEQTKKFKWTDWKICKPPVLSASQNFTGIGTY